MGYKLHRATELDSLGRPVWVISTNAGIVVARFYGDVMYQYALKLQEELNK